MTRRITMWAIALSAGLAAGPARGDGPPTRPEDAAVRQTDNLRVVLSADPAAVAPGQTVMLAVSFKFRQGGLHAYGHDTPDPSIAVPTTVKPLGPAGFQFGPPAYPPSKPADIAGFKVTEYDKDFVVTVVARAPPDLAGQAVTFRVQASYQVCTDQACLEGADANTPPLMLTLPIAGSGGTTQPAAPPPRPASQREATSPANETPAAPADAAIRAYRPPPAQQPDTPVVLFGIELSQANWPIGLLLSLLVGLALNLTPCVLPIIPLTVGYFVYQSQQAAAGGGRRGGILAAGVTFAAGLVATFALLGVLVVLLRNQSSVLFERPEGVFVLGLFIVVMALGMFGVYPVQLPAFVGRLAGGRPGLGGAFIMGVLAAVLSTPCTGPVLGGMINLALKLPAALGLACFVGMGLGMAIPYLVLTAAPGLLDRVPRSGRWTELVKIALGFVLLALAASVFAGLRSQPERWQYAIWASVVLAAAVWIAANVIPGGEHRWGWPARWALLAVIVAGIAWQWPAAPALSPIGLDAGGASAGTQPDSRGALPGRRFRAGQTVWYDYDDAILDRARRARRPVMLDLVSDNCTYCRIMEQKVWPTETARDALAGIAPVRVNTSLPGNEGVFARYGVQGPPALVFIDGDGAVAKVIWPVDFYADPAGFARAVEPIRRTLHLP